MHTDRPHFPPETFSGRVITLPVTFWIEGVASRIVAFSLLLTVSFPASFLEFESDFPFAASSVLPLPNTNTFPDVVRASVVSSERAAARKVSPLII